MSQDNAGLSDLAYRLRRAMDGADLDSMAELLDPNVTWGPPDDPVSGCHNRSEVLAWWGRSAARGRRARVTEVAIGADKLLVGFKVIDAETAAGDQSVDADRWQVMTVRDGRVSDIRGFDDRGVAARRAGVST